MKQISLNRISTCIKEVQEVKTEIKSKIAVHFVEFKKKVVLSLEKAERSIMAKINDACTSSIDVLSKLNNVELTIFETQKYQCQTNKLVESIKFLNIELLLKGIIDQIKFCVDQTRKIKVLQELPKIIQQKEIVRFDKTIKIQSQPIQKLSFVNKKLVEICENSVTIQKNTINKKFDYVLPIKIQNKQKQILFALHDGTISLYNDKLTLHSFKKFDYTIGNILKAYQIRNYVIIIQHNKINRVNLNNLNEIYVKTFKEELTAFGQQMYRGYLVVGFLNRIALMDFDTLEEVTVVNFIGRVKNIYLFKQQYIIIGLSQGIKIYKNLQEIELGAWSNSWTILEEIKCYQESMYATSQSFLFSISIQRAENGGQVLVAKKINEAQTKIIKSVASRGYQIFCLGANGKKIYVYSF